MTADSQKQLAVLDEKINLITQRQKNPLIYWLAVSSYLVVVAFLILFLYELTSNYWYHQSQRVFVAIGAIGLFSWSIKFLHISRSLIYKNLISRYLLKKKKGPEKEIEELAVIIPTYQEKD